MKTLVIFAHPRNKGHNTYILEQVIKNLKKRNIKYTLLDLYKEKYNPVFSAKEHTYYSDSKYRNKDTLKYQKLINTHKNLIFIYPIWWGSMPAILKGFFDRTFTAGWAFRYVNRIPIGLLKNKATIFISAGAPKFALNFLQLRRPIFNITIDILRFCGIRSKTVIFGNSRKLKDSRKQLIERKVKKAISKLKD